METNYSMLKKLLEIYHPKERGILLNEEFDLIKRTLHLDEMDILALRNLRDFVVAMMGHSDDVEDWDRISAITSCIDHSIFNLGENV